MYGPNSMTPTLVCIAGVASNVGKTQLVCDLLGQNPGWEAVKISKGHRRSCGKRREGCCISPFLGDEARILSGREETFAAGKDTGRYWEAGAGNVHWAICTNEQVEAGVILALHRVAAEGAFVEGTSPLKYVRFDYSVMVISESGLDIKSTAVSVMPKIDALFVTGAEADLGVVGRFRERLRRRGTELTDVPVYFERELGRLVDEVRMVHQRRCLYRTGQPWGGQPHVERDRQQSKEPVIG